MPPKPPLTHFLCLPLATPISRPQLQYSLSRFAAEVSKSDENGKPQIPALALRRVGAIHFTIGVMSLQDPERIQRACEFLRSLNVSELLRDILLSTDSVNAGSKQDTSRPPRPIKTSKAGEQPLKSFLSQQDLSTIPSKKPESLMISLTNLSPMHSPTATSSLHASPDPLYPILTFAQRLHDTFLTAGFLIPPPKSRPLKLHATLVNTIYVKKGTASGKNRWGKGSGKIDAREVIEKWGETIWAEDVRVQKVAICEMGAKKVVDEIGRVSDEIYTEVASVALP